VYVRGEVIPRIEPPFLDLHAARWTATSNYEVRADAKRFENWEANIAAKLGLGAAVDYALELGLDRSWETLWRQAERLRSEIASIPGATVHDLGKVRGGIVTFTVDGHEADALVAGLQAQAINTVSSSQFSTRYDMEDRGLTKLVRASVHYLTTDSEIDRLVSAVRALTAKRR
jgi:selenocysteine lyase/cysteine desulfurase